ncbi:MAG: hypothetical protein QM754_12450 [Tepidisphaeraceae bacterium]
MDISIEDATFAELDAVARAVGMTPAEFVRQAAESELKRHKAVDVARPGDRENAAAPSDMDVPEARYRPPTPQEIAENRLVKQLVVLPPHDPGRCLLPNLDDIDAVLRAGEGEDYK